MSVSLQICASEVMAPRALRLFLRMGGGYVKMGQVLSNRGDALPEPYIREFSTLQDAVPEAHGAATKHSLHSPCELDATLRQTLKARILRDEMVQF